MSLNLKVEWKGNDITSTVVQLPGLEVLIHLPDHWNLV